MTLTLNCLRCGDEYEQEKRRASHFCAACRVEIDREKAAERMRRLRGVSSRVTLDIVMGENVSDDDGDDGSTEWLMGARRVDVFARAADYIDRVESGGLFDLVPDRMPAGHSSPAGPDEGTSTNWTDLAAELDRHARDVAGHYWFGRNPHWSYELHDDAKASAYF